MTQPSARILFLKGTARRSQDEGTAEKHKNENFNTLNTMEMRVNLRNRACIL